MELKIDEVFTFKLNSGEELIAKVKQIELAQNLIMVEEPVSIAPNHQGMGLIPSMFTAEPRGLVRLNTNSVSLIAPTEDNVKMKYLEALTGIKVPSKKIVLG